MKSLYKSHINEEEWDRIAKVLDIPVEKIKEKNFPVSIKNNNCTFNDNAVGIQYVNIPQDVLEIIIKYNNRLEEDNLMLKKQIETIS
jgi:hypothetical protein